MEKHFNKLLIFGSFALAFAIAFYITKKKMEAISVMRDYKITEKDAKFIKAVEKEILLGQKRKFR